jgi:serine/threonine-protein kinase
VPRLESGATTLPEDLLREQAIRVQLLYAIGIVLWAINFLLDIRLAPHGDRGPYRLWIEAAAAASAAIGALIARYARLTHRTKVELGVALMVPHALALALLNSWTAQPTTMRPLSPVTVLILFFGMMAPARPSRILTASLVAATMDPVGVWIAHLRGLPVPSPLNTLLMFHANYVCAVLTVVPSRILYRLGRQIREARALGSYELVRRLGVGGMGEVWLARHHLLARTAAIKLIRPEMLTSGDPGRASMTIGRFEREAQATAALTSPHTIRLFDFGHTDDGTFYYVMELLNGRDLESLIRSIGPLPPARAMYLLSQVCRSLAEAHAVGLVHRDIKPANIYVCRMGLEHDFVKVLDFGLVKGADRRAGVDVTVDHVTVGTPAYMAPEAILGHDVDCRADVYAVGCVAYFLLTGECVFSGPTSMNLLMQHVQEIPIRPSERSELSISQELDELVLACLEKDRRKRPRDAEAVLELIAGCPTTDSWDQRRARAWWRTHLPNAAATAPTVAAPTHEMTRMNVVRQAI